MNLLIFFDLTNNRHATISNFTLQGQNVQMFLSFTYNQGKIYLILPIIPGWEHVYLVSIGRCPLVYGPCLVHAGQQAKFSVGSKSHTSECLVSYSLECHESVFKTAVCMKVTSSAVLESQTRQVNKDQNFLVAKI